MVAPVPAIKLCMDCKNVVKGISKGSPEGAYICGAPESIKGPASLVTGEVPRHPCKYMREPGSLCGPDGRLYL